MSILKMLIKSFEISNINSRVLKIMELLQELTEIHLYNQLSEKK